MSEIISTRRKVAIQAVESYRSWDIETIMAYRADNCIHEIAPKSLKQPSMNNEDYRKYFTSIMPYFSDFEPTIDCLVEDEKANKIIVWAHSQGNNVLGPYANEYMLLFYFNEAGDKVERFVEFVDSDYSRNTFSRLYKHIAELKEKKKQQEEQAQEVQA